MVFIKFIFEKATLLHTLNQTLYTVLSLTFLVQSIKQTKSKTVCTIKCSGLDYMFFQQSLSGTRSFPLQGCYIRRPLDHKEKHFHNVLIFLNSVNLTFYSDLSVFFYKINEVTQYLHYHHKMF